MSFLPVDLSGKVAIVTGGNSGIGKAIVMGLAHAGCTVAVAARSSTKNDETVRDIERHFGLKTVGIELDVRSVTSIRGMVDQVIDMFGQVDILVNNAGVTRRASLMDMIEEHWDDVLDTNLKGVFFCTQAAARYMVPRRYGRIINITSIAGRGWTDPEGINYASSKAGVIQMTKSCARALGQYNINVNAVAPGSVDTPILYFNRTAEQVQHYINNAVTYAAIGRIGVTDDIANGVLFLASDHASFVDGQTLAIDGGRFDLM